MYPGRKILVPMKAKSANSCMRFIRKPLRTQEMAEMAEVARCWYLINIAICLPFNLFTNVVMLNETSSKSKLLILNLNLVLLKMYAASETSVDICRVRRLGPLFNDRLALAFLFGLPCWSTELQSFCFLLQLLNKCLIKTTCKTSRCTGSRVRWCIVQSNSRHFNFCHGSHSVIFEDSNGC